MDERFFQQWKTEIQIMFENVSNDVQQLWKSIQEKAGKAEFELVDNYVRNLRANDEQNNHKLLEIEKNQDETKSTL